MGEGGEEEEENLMDSDKTAAAAFNYLFYANVSAFYYVRSG